MPVWNANTVISHFISLHVGAVIFSLVKFSLRPPRFTFFKTVSILSIKSRANENNMVAENREELATDALHCGYINIKNSHNEESTTHNVRSTSYIVACTTYNVISTAYNVMSTSYTVTWAAYKEVRTSYIVRWTSCNLVSPTYNKLCTTHNREMTSDKEVSSPYNEECTTCNEIK